MKARRWYVGEHIKDFASAYYYMEAALELDDEFLRRAIRTVVEVNECRKLFKPLWREICGTDK